jgi:hypothetical protein
VLLKPGLYPVHGVIYIKSSGVVLRGSGEGTSSTDNTILQGKYDLPHQRTLIVIGGNEKTRWRDEVPGSRVNIASEYVPAGSRTIEVEDASNLSEGDNIIIRHPSTDEWLEAVDYGGTGSDGPWEPGDIDMYFNRFITRIEGNKIKLDAPLYHEIDRSLSQAYAWIFTRSNLITESGIENLRVDIETNGSEDEDHIWNGIRFVRVEDCWAKNVTVLHFGFAGIFFEDASRSTVLNCSALEPISIIDGSRRYNFNLGSASNNILFKNCHASEGRHAFVSNGTSSVSGIVFTNCSSIDDYTSSESHRRWGQGILWDKCSLNSNNTTRVLGLYNRGDWGTGHGWSVTNSVAWNVSAPSNQIVIQKPPLGQNYAIACEATVDNNGPFYHPAGWIEGTGENVTPASLYETQLAERLTFGVGPDAPAKLKTSDSFTDTSRYVTLEWIDIALDEDQYVVERSSEGGNTFQVVAQLIKDIQSFTDEGLPKGIYYYRVKAVNTIGASAYSNVLQVDLISGLKSFVNQQGIDVFPNPIIDFLTVKTSLPVRKVVLYDVISKVVKYENINHGGEILINVRDLSNGIYILHVYFDNNWMAAKRIIKNG